jgi:hypothetical protein
LVLHIYENFCSIALDMLGGNSVFYTAKNLSTQLIYGIRKPAFPFYISAALSYAVLQHQKPKMAKLGAHRFFSGLLWLG